MGNMNKVILIGRLGQDPELKYVGKNETAVVNISLATSEKYKNKAGDQVDDTQWHNLTFWSRTAEILEQYCTSGSQIYVEGKLKTESWEDDDENTRYTTKIIVSVLQLLDKPAETSNPKPGKSKTAGKKKQSKSKGKPKFDPDTGDLIEDDIPF